MGDIWQSVINLLCYTRFVLIAESIKMKCSLSYSFSLKLEKPRKWLFLFEKGNINT